MIDYKDEVVFDHNLSAAVGKDDRNPWYVAFGSSLKADGFSPATISCAPGKRKGLGKDASLKFSVSIDGGESVIIPIYIAGSYESEEALRLNFTLLKEKAEKLGIKLISENEFLAKSSFAPSVLKPKRMISINSTAS